MSTNNRQFCIIGCGRLGVCLAVFLSDQGFRPVAFCSKSPYSARHAAVMAGGGKVYDDPVAAAKSCDLVFITTPDTQIEPVCQQIATGQGFTGDSRVFHLSGALCSGILKSAGEMGAATGSIHPLQAFAPYTPGQKSPFEGINISIEGSDRAVALAREIVTALKANSFTIPTHAKTVYHAAAVVASNYLVTLEHFALCLLGEAGLNEQDAYGVLEPLIQGTLNNIKAQGSVKALTGPVARGDHKIIACHLADIDKKVPQFSDLYRLLGSHTLDLANLRGGLEPEARDKLACLFKIPGIQ